MARPADCEAPMHSPAMFAAPQNSAAPSASQASKIMTTQPHSVAAMARTWPMPSCR